MTLDLSLDPIICKALSHPLAFETYKLLARWAGPPPSTTHLAKRLSTELYKVSRVLSRLQRAGLVTYHPCGRLRHWKAVPIKGWDITNEKNLPLEVCYRHKPKSFS